VACSQHEHLALHSDGSGARSQGSRHKVIFRSHGHVGASGLRLTQFSSSQGHFLNCDWTSTWRTSSLDKPEASTWPGTAPSLENKPCLREMSRIHG
jgi:hypothetical protein